VAEQPRDHVRAAAAGAADEREMFDLWGQAPEKASGS
jgi:hypothetical protein